MGDRDIYQRLGIDRQYGTYIDTPTLTELELLFQKNEQPKTLLDGHRLNPDFSEILRDIHFKAARVCDPERGIFGIGLSRPQDYIPRCRIDCMNMIAWTLLHTYRERKLYGGFIRDYIVANISPNDFDCLLYDDEVYGDPAKKIKWISNLFKQLETDWPAGHTFFKGPDKEMKFSKMISWRMLLNFNTDPGLPDGVRPLLAVPGREEEAKIDQTYDAIDFDCQRRIWDSLNYYPGVSSDIDSLSITKDGITVKRPGLLGAYGGIESPFSSVARSIYHGILRVFVFYQDPDRTGERVTRMEARNMRMLNSADVTGVYPDFFKIGVIIERPEIRRDYTDCYFQPTRDPAQKQICERLVGMYRLGLDFPKITEAQPPQAEPAQAREAMYRIGDIVILNDDNAAQITEVSSDGKQYRINLSDGREVIIGEDQIKRRFTDGEDAKADMRRTKQPAPEVFGQAGPFEQAREAMYRIGDILILNDDRMGKIIKVSPDGEQYRIILEDGSKVTIREDQVKRGFTEKELAQEEAQRAQEESRRARAAARLALVPEPDPALNLLKRPIETPIEQLDFSERQKAQAKQRRLNEKKADALRLPDQEQFPKWFGGKSGESSSRNLDQVVEYIPLPRGQDISESSLNLKQEISSIRSIIDSKKPEWRDQYNEILDSLILETLIVIKIRDQLVGGNIKKYKKRTAKKTKRTTKKSKRTAKKSKRTTKKSK